jgi:prolipoprotein diacylglyceryltransferase
MIMDLAIFVLLVWLARGVTRSARGRLRWNWRPRYPRDGNLFWIYLGVYSLGRFFIQFYRVDTPFALGLSQAQLLSVLMAMVAVWALVYQAAQARRLARRAAPAQRDAEPPEPEAEPVEGEAVTR